MIKSVKKHLAKRKVILLTLLVSLVLASSGFWYWNRQIGADVINSGNTIQGYVYGNDKGILSDGGRPVADAMVQIIGQKSTMFTRTNSRGYFTQRLNDPVECVYKVVFYASGYNAQRIFWQSANQPSGLNGMRVTLEKEIDATYSNYFSSTYFEGYEGGYRVGNWDTSYFRNPITPDKFISSNTADPWAVRAPSSAKIKLNIQKLPPQFISDGVARVKPVDQPFKVDPYKVKLSAFAIQSVWESNISSANYGDPVGSLEFTVDRDLSGTSLEMNLDLSKLTLAQRYFAYVNGFRIIYSSQDTNGNWYVNFTRSEDKSPNTISYSGNDTYTDLPEEALRSCIVTEAKKHVGGQYILGADNGITANGKLLPVDCSGLVNTSYKKVGLKTGGSSDRNNTQTIWPYFKPINKGNLKPGDLVFKVPKSTNWPYGHVGIYVGNNQIVEAKGSKFGVIYSSIDSWLAFARHPLFALENNEKAGNTSSPTPAQVTPASGKDAQAVLDTLNKKFKTSEFPLASGITKFTGGAVSIINNVARAEIFPSFTVNSKVFPADAGIVELQKILNDWKITNIGTGI